MRIWRIFLRLMWRPKKKSRTGINKIYYKIRRFMKVFSVFLATRGWLKIQPGRVVQNYKRQTGRPVPNLLVGCLCRQMLSDTQSRSRRCSPQPKAQLAFFFLRNPDSISVNSIFNMGYSITLRLINSVSLVLPILYRGFGHAWHSYCNLALPIWD